MNQRRNASAASGGAAVSQVRIAEAGADMQALRAINPNFCVTEARKFYEETRCPCAF